MEAFCDRSHEALLARDPSVRVGRIATSTAFLGFGTLPAFLGGLLSLVRYRRQRPDIVWLQYVNLPDLAYLLLAKLLGHRVMVTPHLGSNWRSQRNPLLRFASGTLLRLANRIALISRSQELEIALPAGVPRSLIRNFLPDSLLRSELKEKAPGAARLELVHSGRLSAGKGTFLLIEVCDRLKRAGIPFRTRITGAADADTLSTMKNMIGKMDLAAEVEIMGRVPEEELLAVLASSDVLVHLSRIDSYPLIVLESMACSVFPVCLELAGARDMVETYDGFVASEADPVGETAEFLRTHDVAALRERGRAAGLRVRTDYDWSNCAAALQAALDATLAKRP